MKKRIVFLIHTLYWFYIVFQSFFLSVQINPEMKINSSEFVFFMVISFVFFYLFYFTLPFLFKQKNKFFSISLGLILTLIFAFFKEIIFIKVGETGFFNNGKKEVLQLDFNLYLYHFRSAVVNSIYALLIFILIEWIKSQKRQAELILQKQESELALLRSQINPHFLFNTLNNIDSLIYKDQDKASASVIKLSEIMRYMIYDTSDEKVLLKKEIEYLQSFISLQQLRIRDPDYISFSIKGSVDTKTVAPMLFVPFLENAFKHSCKQIKSPGIIFEMNIGEQELSFTSTNFYDESGIQVKDKTSGIGLNNVQRRLSLLYPGRHNLKILKENGIFKVELLLKF